MSPRISTHLTHTMQGIFWDWAYLLHKELPRGHLPNVTSASCIGSLSVWLPPVRVADATHMWFIARWEFMLLVAPTSKPSYSFSHPCGQTSLPGTIIWRHRELLQANKVMIKFIFNYVIWSEMIWKVRDFLQNRFLWI